MPPPGLGGGGRFLPLRHVCGVEMWWKDGGGLPHGGGLDRTDGWGLRCGLDGQFVEARRPLGTLTLVLSLLRFLPGPASAPPVRRPPGRGAHDHSGGGGPTGPVRHLQWWDLLDDAMDVPGVGGSFPRLGGRGNWSAREGGLGRGRENPPGSGSGVLTRSGDSDLHGGLPSTRRRGRAGRERRGRGADPQPPPASNGKRPVARGGRDE